MAANERISSRQREAMDAWSRYLCRRGYVTRQIALAMELSQSSISNSLARTGTPARRKMGRLADPVPGSVGWRELKPVPGTAMASGKLNQGGLLTSALLTWQSRNAVSTFAHRRQEASEAELKEGAAALEQTIEYARLLQRVLTEPEFAEQVRNDPSYRDDIGHRFRP